MQEAAYLAGLAIDNCGTGVAHSIGHALGSRYHVPHGISVAIGLGAALEWNVEGEPEAYADVASGMGCDVDDIPNVFAAAVRRHRAARATGRSRVDVSVDEIAVTMNAVENQPMLDNNVAQCRRRRPSNARRTRRSRCGTVSVS